MSKKLEALRGMEDILPGEVEKWQWLEQKAAVFFESRGCKEIRTPVLEYTELFQRSVGESSDIVHKEMFSFQDRGERNITLRPEMTASVARSVIEKGLLTQAKSLRLYYVGPMFRAERPQAGRKRQFHQIGAELVNESGWKADLECLTLLHDFLKYTGLNDLSLRLNDLGSLDEQRKMAAELKVYFEGQKSRLCKDCQWRLEKNVLRIFDCKIESCQPVIDQAPWDKIAPLNEEFRQLTEALKGRGITFEMKRRLVRGLDYYNGTVFEIAAKGLGTQDALAGGGRYDRLYADLGGPAAFCTGFSIGMERLLMALSHAGALENRKIFPARIQAALLETSPEAEKIFHETVLSLREAGVRIETLPGEVNLAKHLKKANQAGIQYVLMLGSQEAAQKAWTVKDMDAKTQTPIPYSEIMAYFKNHFHL